MAMTEVFVIRNQLGHYWGKSKAWVDGSLPRQVLRSAHRDEAINTLVELNSKDFELRGDVLTAQLSERGEPVIEASQIPLPMEPEVETPPEASSTEPPEDSPEGSTSADEPIA
jgi:hypothetical protein